MCTKTTVFENHRKSLIQHCERSELRLHFEWKKFLKNAKNSQFGQKILENAKIENETFWVIFKHCEWSLHKTSRLLFCAIRIPVVTKENIKKAILLFLFDENFQLVWTTKGMLKKCIFIYRTSNEYRCRKPHWNQIRQVLIRWRQVGFRKSDSRLGDPFATRDRKLFSARLTHPQPGSLTVTPWRSSIQ